MESKQSWMFHLQTSKKRKMSRKLDPCLLFSQDLSNIVADIPQFTHLELAFQLLVSSCELSCQWPAPPKSFSFLQKTTKIHFLTVLSLSLCKQRRQVVWRVPLVCSNPSTGLTVPLLSKGQEETISRLIWSSLQCSQQSVPAALWDLVASWS